MIYQVIVIDLEGNKKAIDLCDNEKYMQRITVMELKKKIAVKIPGMAADEDIELVFGQERLNEENKRLFDYGIQHMSVIGMLIKLPGGLPH
uniref:Ubiquitin-like domain-containing protein n=1 Tax=Cyprinodon variegatus TaxID=28743 RepID=A0A3Q2CPU9_CYPVA